MLIFVVSLMAACEAETDASSTSDAGTDEGAGEGTDVGTDEGTDEGKDEGTGDARDNLKSSLEDNPEYKVEYDMIYASDREENVVINTKDGQTRVDVLSDNEEYTFWMNGESVLKYEGQCVDFGMAENFGFDPESIYDMTTIDEGSIRSDDEYLDVSSIGTKTIAGRTTDCYEVVYDSEATSRLSTYCLSDQGIPVLLRIEDGDTGEVMRELRAERLEDSVNEDVFEPCEPEMDVSGFM